MHDKETPEGFQFLTNVGDPPNTERSLDFESEADFIDRITSELGDNVVFTTPAYDCDGHAWEGMAVHVRKGVAFNMFKPRT